jgi:tetratricopeptide (TPR) repeat protein
MALFRDRAGIEGQDTAVESICDLLDDHPLALVVAAGRVQAEAMSLERLRERLADQQTRLATLRLGSGSGRDRNVWASFQLSYDDLSEAQQRVFTHLAACYGESAGLEFLALVCDLAEEECEDHLGRLVARSLAERQDDRFSLGQLVRDFGREVIEDEVEEVSAQIEEAALTYAQRYAERTPGAFDRLEAELENLLGVAERAGAEEDWNTVVALAQGLEDMLDLRGYWAERVALNEMGLQGARDTGDEISQAWLAHNLALAVQSQGNLEQALELYQESLELNRKQDHPEGVANTLHNMGIIAQDQGELERARELYEQGLEIHQELDNPTGLANSLHQLGRISQDLGELERAQELFEQSLEIEKELRNDAGIAISLHALGQLAQDQEELERARELFEQSLAINRRLGNLSGIAGLLHQLGVMTQDEGDLQQASELYRQSLEIKERLGDLGGIADSLHQLGVIAQEQGDLENARTLMQGSLDIERQMGNLSGIGISLHQFGSLAEAEGNTDEAKEKYREALEIFEHLESPYADLARNDLERLEQGE